MSQSIEMQQLRHFCAVVDHGQIAAAARAVAITQPSLSRSIRNLEAALGFTLLERSHSGVVTTANGEVFVDHARFILNEVKRAQDNLQTLNGLARGRVTLGITGNFDTFLMPETLGKLLKDNRGLSVVIASGFYEELLIKVRTGELDFALALVPDVHGHPDLSEEEVLPVAYHVYGPATHPLAGRRNLTLAEVAACDWVMPDQQAMRIFDRYFDAVGVTAPHAVMWSNSIPLVIATIRSAGLLTVMADHLMEHDVQSGRVVALDVPALPTQNSAAIIVRKSALFSPAAKAFMASIREACSIWTKRAELSRATRTVPKRK